jgi:large subunit ribosomal protein L21
MGKGDKKSRKGKRLMGTRGVHRPRTDKNSIPVATAKKKKATKKDAPKKKEVVIETAEEVKAPVKKATAKKTSTKGDDLTKIEGVGPKVKEVLGEAGISTFADLAKMEADKVAEILIAANSRYKMFNPTTWPKQAEMAAAGNWDELKKWQDELDGGK